MLQNRANRLKIQIKTNTGHRAEDNEIKEHVWRVMSSGECRADVACFVVRLGRLSVGVLEPQECWLVTRRAMPGTHRTEHRS